MMFRRGLFLGLGSLLVIAQFITYRRFVSTTAEVEDGAAQKLPPTGPALAQSKGSLHKEHIAILPLLPWEQEAIRNLQSGSTACNHPAEFQDTCCPGSFSRGGEMTTRKRTRCAHAGYDQVAMFAQQFLDTWNGRTTTTSSRERCDVCRILKVLRRSNQTLTVLGDSIMSQAFDGLVCELRRRAYLVEKKDTVRTHPELIGFGNIKSNSTVLVRSPHWPPREVVRMQMFFVYSVPLEIPQEAEEINNAGGVLWMNFGVHDDEDIPWLQSRMKAFFSTIKANATFSRVFFRETSAQHFDIPGGTYSHEKHRSTKCTPLEWTNQVGTRDAATKVAAREAGYDIVSLTDSSDESKLVMLPFHNFTAQLHGNHPYDPSRAIGECTHFCSTPLLWMPLWRTLRIALDTAFFQNSTSTHVPN